MLSAIALVIASLTAGSAAAGGSVGGGRGPGAGQVRQNSQAGSPRLGKGGLVSWDPFDRDPVVVRLGLSEAQKTRIAEVYKEYLAERAKVVEKYRTVRMAQLRRQMWKDLAELNARYKVKIEEILDEGQKVKLVAGTGIVELYRAKIAAAREEINSNGLMAKRDPEKFAKLKSRAEARIKSFGQAMTRDLDAKVGRLRTGSLKGTRAAK